MALSSGLMMCLLMVLGETAGSPPIEFVVIDAETGERLPAVMVRQLPPTWEVRFIFKRSRGLEGLASRYTDRNGVVRCENVSRGTYFFETEDYLSVDVHKSWFGLKAYEEPYKHGTEVKAVDGVYVVPLRRKDSTP